MKKTCENSAKIKKSEPIYDFQQIGQNIDKKEQIEAFWGNIDINWTFFDDFKWFVIILVWFLNKNPYFK